MDQTRFSVFIDFLSLLGFCTTPHSAITNPNPKLLTLNVTVNLTLYLTLTNSNVKPDTNLNPNCGCGSVGEKIKESPFSVFTQIHNWFHEDGVYTAGTDTFGNTDKMQASFIICSMLYAIAMGQITRKSLSGCEFVLTVIDVICY